MKLLRRAIVVAFAFTLSHFDGCGTPYSKILGPFPNKQACEQAHSQYDESSSGYKSITNCWEIPRD